MTYRSPPRTKTIPRTGDTPWSPEGGHGDPPLRPMLLLEQAHSYPQLT